MSFVGDMFKLLAYDVGPLRADVTRRAGSRLNVARLQVFETVGQSTFDPATSF